MTHALFLFVTDHQVLHEGLSEIPPCHGLLLVVHGVCIPESQLAEGPEHLDEEFGHTSRLSISILGESCIKPVINVQVVPGPKGFSKQNPEANCYFQSSDGNLC